MTDINNLMTKDARQQDIALRVEAAKDYLGTNWVLHRRTTFKRTSSQDTDIRKTFERVRQRPNF